MSVYLPLECDCGQEHNVYFRDGPPNKNDLVQYACPSGNVLQLIIMRFVSCYFPVKEIPGDSIIGKVQ